MPPHENLRCIIITSIAAVIIIPVNEKVFHYSIFVLSLYNNYIGHNLRFALSDLSIALILLAIVI